MDGERRFRVRRGWLRNRRAVVLDAEGITVQPWVGRSRRVAWGDVVSTRWDRADRLKIRTIDDRLYFGLGIDRLRELARAIDAEISRRRDEAGSIVIDEDDAMRWLRGYTFEVLDPAPPARDRMASGLLCLLAGAVADYAITELLWRIVTGHGTPDHGDPGYYLAQTAYMLTAVPLVGLTLLAHDLWSRRRSGRYRLFASGRGVVIWLDAARQCSFAWSSVVGILHKEAAHVVRLESGDQVSIPRYDGFAPVIETLDAVVRHRHGFAVAGELVPQTALSLTRTTFRSTGSDRGLSPAARVEVDA